MKASLLAIASLVLISLGSYLVLLFPYPSKYVSGFDSLLLFSGLAFFFAGTALGLITFLVFARRRRLGIFHRNLKTGLVSGIIAAVAFNIVKALLSLVIPPRVIPAGLVTAPETETDFFVSLIFGSLFLAVAVGWAFEAYYEKIPTRNAITKSTILSMTFLLLLYFLFALSDLNNSFSFFAIAFLLEVPEFLVFGLVLGYVYSKLSRGQNGTSTMRKVSM